MKTHTIVINPKCNGGEALLLSTEFVGDSMYQTLTLNSYGNSASLNFLGYLTPTRLREMADELEAASQQAKLTE